MARETQVKARKRIRKIVARYTVVIERDEETGQYCVTVPALPGCITYGNTFEEAIENAQECIIGFIEASRKVNMPVPVEVEVNVEAEVFK